MSKHTEGPWVREMNDFGGQIEVTAGSREGRVEIAAIQVGYDEPFESEQVANARLIAAAPDLLEALEAAVDLLDCTVDQDWRDMRLPLPDRQAFKAAIAKAKGEGND